MNREVSIVFRDSYALARLLPDNVKWSVMIEDTNSIKLPVAFNVFVRDEEERRKVRAHMNYGNPVWESADCEEHKYSPRVTLGIIQEENK